MKVFFLGLLLAANAIPAFASQSNADIMTDKMKVETMWNTQLFDCIEQGNTMEFHKKCNRVAENEEATSKLAIHLDYDEDNYTFKTLSIIDENGIKVESVASSNGWDSPYNNLKDIEFDIADGTYVLLVSFTNKLNGKRVYHFTENVVVNNKASVTINAAECINTISFRALNINGERFIPEQYEIDRYGNKTPTGYKNCYVTYPGFAVYVNNRYQSITGGREINSTIDKNGNISNGEENWTVMINEVSPKCGVMGYTLAVAPEGTYAISLPADGCGSQMVTNEYGNCEYREVKFVPTRNRRQTLNSKVSKKSYITYLGIIDIDDNITVSGANYLHFEYPTGEEESLPEIADIYIFSAHTPTNPCPLRISTSPASYESLIFDFTTGYQECYFTTAQSFTTPDLVKMTPAVISGLVSYARSPQNVPYPYNDNYDYDCSEPILLGGNVPILTFANNNVVSDINPWAYTGMDFGYIGRYGELRESDCFFTDMTRTHSDKKNEETISGKLSVTPHDNYGEYAVIPPVMNGFEKIKMTFHNANTNVDDLMGVNDTEINYYCDQLGKHSPLPVLRMLQFREGTKVTDRFFKPKEATVSLSVGNFKAKFDEWEDEDGDWHLGNQWLDYWDVPFDVKVEYAPYGTKEWRPIDIEEIEEQFQPLAWGRFFTGSLSSVDVNSPNEWYDLRVSITYDENNNQTQILSPAFKINGSNSVESMPVDLNATPIYYNLQGLRIPNPVKGEMVIEVRNGKSVKKIF